LSAPTTTTQCKHTRTKFDKIKEAGILNQRAKVLSNVSAVRQVADRFRGNLRGIVIAAYASPFFSGSDGSLRLVLDGESTASWCHSAALVATANFVWS
jgi:hypothetical protein